MRCEIIQENRSTIFGIIALIIGATGLGVGTYSVVNFQIIEGSPGQDGQDGNDGEQGLPGTIGIVVAIWESLFRNMEFTPHTTVTDWLIEVDDIQVNNSNYFDLSRNNTRVHLNISGWYRVSIMTNIYWVGGGGLLYLDVLKEGVVHQRVYRQIYDPDEGIYYSFNNQFFISSNGTHYYEFNFHNANSDLTPVQIHNQLGIEYVGDL